MRALGYVTAHYGKKSFLQFNLDGLYSPRNLRRMPKAANNTEPVISIRTAEGSGTEEKVSVIVREPVKDRCLTNGEV